MVLIGGCTVLWILCYPLCWAVEEAMDDPWNGRMTVRVNVRKAPGSESEIITQIDRGYIVGVSDARHGWYKVMVEEDTFGIIGWVHGKYVERIDTDPSSEFVNPVVSAIAVNPLRVVTPSFGSSLDSKSKVPLTTEKTTGPIDQTRSQSNESLPQTVHSKDRQTSAQAPEAKASDADSGIPPEEPEEDVATLRGGLTAMNDVTQEIDARDPPVEVKETPSTAAEEEVLDDYTLETERLPTPSSKKIELLTATREKPFPESQTPAGMTDSIEEMMTFEKDTPPPDIVKNNAAQRDRLAGKSSKELFSPAEAKTITGTRNGLSLRGLVEVVIRLLVVAFSCVALIFSQRAWYKATAKARS